MERSGKGPALSLCPYTLKLCGPLARMLDTWVPGRLTLIFVLISSLRRVSTNEVSETSVSFGGPNGVEARLRAQSWPLLVRKSLNIHCVVFGNSEGRDLRGRPRGNLDPHLGRVVLLTGNWSQPQP